VIGVATIAISLIVMFAGVRRLIDVQQRPDPFHGTGPGDTGDAVALVSWGVMVLTAGCYGLRAACRREWAKPGARSNLAFGYLLLIVGYAVLGYVFDRTIHEAVRIWEIDTDPEMNELRVRIAVTFLPGAFLGAGTVFWGSKVAQEIVITRANAGMDF
jgi:hypothetical protein